MSTWLAEGADVPDLTLPADDGGPVRLKDLRGLTSVLYFYPRDDTPGCTREACAFRDRSEELKKLGVEVFGISTDDIKSHRKFRDKYALNFPLLSDVDHRAAEAFGAWQEKNMYGKKSWGVQRSTFLLDAECKIRRVWRKVNVDGHDAEVIAAVQALKSAPAAAKPAGVAAQPEKKPAAKKPVAKNPAVKKKAAKKPAVQAKAATAKKPPAKRKPVAHKSKKS